MPDRSTNAAPILLAPRGRGPTLAFQNGERAERYRRNWAYYELGAYTAAELADGGLFEATRADGTALDQARRIFGFAAYVVDKNVRTLFQRRLELRAADPRARAALEEVWRRSRFQQLKYRMGRFGGVTGDVFLEPVWEADGLRIELYDSEAVDVDYDPARGGEIRRVVVGFRNGEPQENREWEEYVRVLTPTRIETYFDGKLDPERSRDHGYGRVPLVHIRNLDLGYYYGRSSFEAIVPALDQLNSALSRVLAIADKYANPHLVATGCDASGLSHELDRVWTIWNESGDLKFLEYKGDVLPALLDQIRLIESHVREVCPEFAVGEAGRGESGHALALRLQDWVAKQNELRGNYGAGIEELAELSLAILEAEGARRFADKRVEVRFEPVLPIDKEARIAELAELQGLGVVDAREIKAILVEEGVLPRMEG